MKSNIKKGVRAPVLLSLMQCLVNEFPIFFKLVK